MVAELEHRTSLVDKLLAEQAQLGTAVEQFSDWHDRGSHDEPLQARHYRSLIPMVRPKAGEQYAFEVNLDQCTGCKACVAACHSLNGLDDDESWRDVGLLVGDVYIPYQQTVTTACHHCVEPACSNGCPVLAYAKDEETGIVRHLDDQCIGCSYCILKCPYDVPKFNKKRGIVRKCDMCHQRLAVGEAPACVQSCPNGAIAIRIVNVSETVAAATSDASTTPTSTYSSGGHLLPDTVSSGYTRPSTRYISSKPVPDTAMAVNAATPPVEHTHGPLVIMLVLTQFAAGTFLFAQSNALVTWIGTAIASLGIGASIAHLGQPLKAWRCFLGLRRSWLSREIVAFGGFPPAGAAAALGFIPSWWVAVIGYVCVFCSVMVYVDTRRPFWQMSQTLPKFFGTGLVLGGALGACFGLVAPGLVLAFTVVKLVLELLYLSRDEEQHTRTKRLLLGPLKVWHFSRFALGMTGAALMLHAPVAGLLVLLAGEILERVIFFRGGAAWRMPGHA
ncbi:nitrate reductase (quinol-dependent) transmembrane subunit [Roseimicrobium gellanilyticum]|uniref:Nitrate reductase (Quinol-dependent) transmembrane subunit n=1 Tax=Roseimicrobium gellanilyticum TaxID=748857 RepID=A0A366HTM4_9BACT|nr:DmsC/YnfH family molybdoenzyme membrane anchor subunit [Roseimicrobium gellanilyticum]RBP47636.1 nitrate reductase (quinol-dependent) transmembrane subunit [Roseimicrobium gellanilyticum]